MSVASRLGVDLPGAESKAPLLYGPDGAPVSSGPKPIHFQEFLFQYFDVEVAEKGSDYIYHFWPPGDGDTFVPGFAKCLENGFRKTLPATADVRADFTTRDESAVLSRHAEMEVRLDKESRSLSDTKWIPRETYFVRVVGGALYPLAETFLKGRLFNNILEAILAHRG